MVGRFIRIKCEQCKNEQVIFNKTSTEIKCLVCNTILAKPTGGTAKVMAKIIQELE
ncbi:MAG: 30S ribosomal protein S27e [Candidatus Aenigmatarchaeota archaeon]